MKDIVEKLKQQEQRMAQEKGPFDLFALFLREDAPDKWDLLVAAEWIEQDKQEVLKYISTALQEVLIPDELLKLSRIVIIDENNPALDAFQKAVNIEHGITEIRDSNFFGLQIKHVYLVTSRKRNNEKKSKTRGKA